MERTLGELVDRLITANIKLYMVQDTIHKAAANNEGLDADTVQKLKALNLDRNKTMTAIDQVLSDAVEQGEAEVDQRIKIL